MREDIKALLDLREAETNTFKEIQESYNRNMGYFDKELDKIRDSCEHTYGKPETNSFFGFSVSECTLCGTTRVTG